MCGITGIYERNSKNYQGIKKILSKISHRGPDANGIWGDNNIFLGSVRLKVVDLDENSNQPFLSKNGRFIIVFNGEIYNFINLKKKFNLLTKTNSDTEVIIELFSKIGPKTFSLLDGMFSIAIYDIFSKKLYLARDPFGIKPLYYFKDKTKFIFCSEIKGILEVKKNIVENKDSLVDLIKWGGLDHSKKTWFKDVYSIEAGSYKIIDRNLNIVNRKYYKLENNLKKINIDNREISNHFSHLLKKSVKDQSQTVRSIGTNLSGGVDSSLVTAFLQESCPKLKTYTFGYKEKKYDERPYARKVSKILKIKNFTSITDSKSINKNFIDTLIMQDEPFTSFRQVSHHNLYKDYKNHGSTVILEASGGDEIGAGYTGFLWPMFIDQAKKTSFENAWKKLLKTLKFHKYDNEKIYKFIISGIYNQKFYGASTSDGQKIVGENCFLSSYIKEHKTNKPYYKKLFDSHLLNSQFIELYHTKLPRGLRYVDRASSGSGREARVPLLNKDIVEFCFSVPNEVKIKNNELRWFMKKSLNFLNKKNIKLKNKKSIADPQRIWMRKDLKKLFLILFKSKRFRERGIFNNIEVLNIYNNFLKDESMHSLGIFQIFITELWFRLFIDNKPSKYSGIKLDEFILETNT